MSPCVSRALFRRPLAALVCLLALLVPASRAAAEPGIRILNSLATADLQLNALTTNRESLKALSSGPLSSKAFASDERLAHQLEHPPALRVMDYLVGCALAPGQKVEWKSLKGEFHTFEGEAGLCPEWERDAPSPECLGYVTACLLARNNAYHLEVELSMRGEDPRDPKRFNPSGASEEWSPMFLPCLAGGFGLEPECGWLGENVGRCTPGEVVTVAAGAPAPDTCTGKVGDIGGDRVLRVCEDARGCTRGDALADADRNKCGGIAPSATFICPASGEYSVMSAPYNRSTPPGTWVRPQATAGAYPAAPFGAFTFREGAFYGNLFDPDALSIEVLLDHEKDFAPYLVRKSYQGYPYLNVFACHSRDWVSGDDHLRSRICANATVGGDSLHGCLALPTGPCEPGSGSTLPRRCDDDDGDKVLGDGDFEGCQDASGFSHPEPITVFLRSPCDVLPEKSRQVCTKKCTYTSYPPRCTTTCRPKSPGECLLATTQPPPQQ
ncbi:hypothetical protein HPC49_41095 [Pyxidicoccus fallax]|uniref:Lipoprotein n=1 Tax=Pyxidicoccus fallax TaxID=394095 RepID=A0A848LYX0_9BACT|nr:hypothetical protein [Pyxidicoccus fallax]NMO22533.1 hypothetical protein [Pyxidicoccus fallax]NPC84599.1 hypothetical protein [Pyxidicoccus fallax]